MPAVPGRRSRRSPSCSNQLLSAQVNGGTPRLTVDLSGLRFVYSAAVGELIRAYRAITQRGGTLELTRPQPAVARVRPAPARQKEADRAPRGPLLQAGGGLRQVGAVPFPD